MTEDRLMVAEAVFKGQLSEEYLTIEEIDEFAALVAEAAMDKLMEDAVERGCAVFGGFEEDLIH